MSALSKTHAIQFFPLSSDTRDHGVNLKLVALYKFKIPSNILLSIQSVQLVVQHIFVELFYSQRNNVSFSLYEKTCEEQINQNLRYRPVIQ